MASGRPASLPSPCPRRAYLDSLCPPGGPGRAFRRQLGPSLESNPCPTANASGRPAAAGRPEFPASSLAGRLIIGRCPGREALAGRRPQSADVGPSDCRFGGGRGRLAPGARR
ncbi:hypothetical protein HPB47_012368 [Ixodes persulcatus]|uniref:Uncharacterized protein n=1 Tax=Ixodes persulcatus TaxID=34615 RepID=A0AC60NTU2_IXOPE|nr:hypothetical protein HPB47_012368 [Ixodes persulcatus]